MLTKENMTKKKVRKLLRMLERWTRNEIIARHGSFQTDYEKKMCTECAVKEMEYRDKIRKYVHGDSNLIELGIKWGILKETVGGHHKTTKKEKRRFKERN
jgi:hypothetical protein